MIKIVTLANEMSATDKKALTIVIVIAVIVLFLAAAIGTCIRLAMSFQAERASRNMANAYDANIVKNEKEYIKYGRIKNLRVLYKQSLPAFGFIALGFAVWAIEGWIINEFKLDMFDKFKDLFYIWDIHNQDYYTYVFGVKLLAEWPALLNKPHIEVPHIAGYFESIFLIIGSAWYLVACQAFLSRFIRIRLDAREIYSRSVRDLKKQREENPDMAPPPPSSD